MKGAGSSLVQPANAGEPPKRLMAWDKIQLACT